VDIGFRYRLPELSFGNFVVTFDGTYISKYDNKVTPDSVTTHVAGHFNRPVRQFRPLARAGWRELEPRSVRCRLAHELHRRRLGGQCRSGTGQLGRRLLSGYAELQHRRLDVQSHAAALRGRQTYHNVMFATNIEPWNSRIEVGVDNLFDKQPPTFYQNNVINSNTDPNTYDTIGRFFFARYTVKF
jgi:outer membrane receptor protein involved in Fe transport